MSSGVVAGSDGGGGRAAGGGAGFTATGGESSLRSHAITARVSL